MASGGMSMMNLPETDSEDELPPGWEERATLDGKVYYTDHATQSTQWVHPKTGKEKVLSKHSLPFGWKREIDDQGNITYLDTINNRTTVTDPRLAFAVEKNSLGGGDDQDGSGKGRTFRQRFDASSTAAQVLHGADLTGKVAVVTGANSGSGFATSLALARQNCRVILACRNAERAQAAIDQMKAKLTHLPRETVDENLNYLQLDLCSLASVKHFALEFSSKFDRLDFLILNAGIGFNEFKVTEDGYEETFQANHLSHFYLTALLSEVMVKTGNSRVVVVSSESHRSSYLTKDNITELRLSPPTPSLFWSMMAYNDSKLCNVAFTAWLQRQFASSNVLCFSVHPGNLFSSSFQKGWWFLRALYFFVRPFTKNLDQAAATSCFAATASELVPFGGCYLNNCCVTVPSVAAMDVEFQDKLAELSVRMVDEKRGVGSCQFVFL